MGKITRLFMIIKTDEQQQKTPEPAPWSDGPKQSGPGPSRPNIDMPNTKRLLDKMKKIDKNASQRYKQRTGQ